MIFLRREGAVSVATLSILLGLVRLVGSVPAVGAAGQPVQLEGGGHQRPGEQAQLLG